MSPRNSRESPCSCTLIYVWLKFNFLSMPWAQHNWPDSMVEDQLCPSRADWFRDSVSQVCCFTQKQSDQLGSKEDLSSRFCAEVTQLIWKGLGWEKSRINGLTLNSWSYFSYFLLQIPSTIYLGAETFIHKLIHSFTKYLLNISNASETDMSLEVG